MLQSRSTDVRCRSTRVPHTYHAAQDRTAGEGLSEGILIAHAILHQRDSRPLLVDHGRELLEHSLRIDGLVHADNVIVGLLGFLGGFQDLGRSKVVLTVDLAPNRHPVPLHSIVIGAGTNGETYTGIPLEDEGVEGSYCAQAVEEDFDGFAHVRRVGRLLICSAVTCFFVGVRCVAVMSVLSQQYCLEVYRTSEPRAEDGFAGVRDPRSRASVAALRVADVVRFLVGLTLHTPLWVSIVFHGNPDSYGFSDFGSCVFIPPHPTV